MEDSLPPMKCVDYGGSSCDYLRAATTREPAFSSVQRTVRHHSPSSFTIIIIIIITSYQQRMRRGSERLKEDSRKTTAQTYAHHRYRVVV